MRNFTRDPNHVSKAALLPAAARERSLMDQARDLFTDGDVAKMHDVIIAGLDAEISVRAPRAIGPDGKAVNNYVVMPDWAARLAAVRLGMAYRFGNPSNTIDMQLAVATPGDQDRKPITREEMVEQLRASGTNLKGIVDTWVNAAKKVEESGELPPDVAEMKQDAESLAVIDV